MVSCGAAGGVVWWWCGGGCYMVVAITPITAIIQQYMRIGIINISISSTLSPPLVDFYYYVFSCIYHTGAAFDIAFVSAVT